MARRGARRGLPGARRRRRVRARAARDRTGSRRSRSPRRCASASPRRRSSTMPRVTVSAGVCDLDYCQDAEQPLPARRRRALLGQAPRPRHELRLRPEHGPRALRPGARRPAPALAGDARDPRAGAGDRREGPLDARALGARRRARGARSAATSAGTTSASRCCTEAALVHDVGKIGVPDQVLLKPGTLDRRGVRGGQAARRARRLDRRGRPHRRAGRVGPPPPRAPRRRAATRDGLAAERIPDGAAILAVADAFDVMTSDRPYSAARSTADALAECREHSGAQFVARSPSRRLRRSISAAAR